MTTERVCENQSNSCAGRLRHVTYLCGCGLHTGRMLVCRSCRDALASGTATCTPCDVDADGTPCYMRAPGLEMPEWKRDWLTDHEQAAVDGMMEAHLASSTSNLGHRRN